MNAPDPQPAFQPGFRLSKTDIASILIFLAAAGWLFSMKQWELGIMLLFVKLHFFLFCNVFRISRPPELIWGVCFVGLFILRTRFPGSIGWPAIYGGGLVLAALLIWLETRKPRYHGILWQKWNPGLPDWWKDYGKSRSKATQP